MFSYADQYECSECGKMVDEEASRCPYCNEKFSENDLDVFDSESLIEEETDEDFEYSEFKFGEMLNQGDKLMHKNIGFYECVMFLITMSFMSGVLLDPLQWIYWIGYGVFGHLLIMKVSNSRKTRFYLYCILLFIVIYLYLINHWEYDVLPKVLNN